MIVGASVGSKNSTMSAPVIVWPARSDSSGIRLFRNPLGPISHASGSRTFLIPLRIGAANSEMNEPRSSEMSPKTTCGEEIWKPLVVSQARAKSIRILVEIDGRIWPNSRAEGAEVDDGVGAEIGAAVDRRLDDLAQVAAEQILERQLAVARRGFGETMLTLPLK